MAAMPAGMESCRQPGVLENTSTRNAGRATSRVEVQPGEKLKAINAAIEAVAREKWGVKADANLKTLRAADKTCLHSGDLKSNYAGFEGMLYVSARNALRPLVIDVNKAPLAEEDGKPYAGCFVNASVELWVQDNNYGKRINATLAGVQFYRDGEHFAGGGVADADEFDDLTAEDLV